MGSETTEMAATLLPAGGANLNNSYIALSLYKASVSSVLVDPDGAGAMRPTGLSWIRVHGMCDTHLPNAQVGDQGRVSIRGIRCAVPVETYHGTDLEIHEGVPIYQWPDVAWHIRQGQVMGQSFEARERFHRAGVYMYAAGKAEDCAYRITLRRDGPGGEKLATTFVEASTAFGFPTIWTFLESEGWEAGRYFLEVSETRGDVRWWSSISDVYEAGCAYVDGEAVSNRDMMFLIGTREIVEFTCDWTITLQDRLLHLAAEIVEATDKARAEELLGFEVAVPWVAEGFGVSSQTPFTRFTTDKTQYVPIEQFKRFPAAWPAYQSPREKPAFGNVNWIRATGREVCDFVFSGFRGTFPWPLDEGKMRLRFSGNRLSIEFAEHVENAPESFPEFFSSDRDFDRVQNSFYYERSFGMSDGHAGSEWMEWIGRQSCWVGNPRAERYRESLLNQKVGDDGYVWAMRYGGGYPHGLRYGRSARARRHYTTNGTFIEGAYLYYCWTRDEEFLAEIMPRLRRAMEFQISSEDTVWQDDLMVIVEPHHDGTGKGTQSTEYDCMPFGYKCAVCNVVFYKSLHAMAELERASGNDARARELEALRPRLKDSYNRHFWNDGAGRYIGCIDVNGVAHDYGFSVVNVAAMEAGLANDAKARRIYDWLENQATSTGEVDAYKFIVGPRTNTIDNQDWWYSGGDKEWPGDTGFGLSFQNGGAFMFISYYDILARLRHVGPEDAFTRYSKILDRYQMPDKLCGGNPLYLGELDGYQVGTSVVFPEAGLLPNSMLYGFLGIEPIAAGLRIRPMLPSRIEFAGVRNVRFGATTLEVRVERGDDDYLITVVCTECPEKTTLVLEDNVLRRNDTGHLWASARGNDVLLRRE